MEGVKVTYIETRFVTSDAAGFKDLVQRLTGRSPTAAAPPAPPAAPHRPRACRAVDGGDGCGRSATAAGPQGYCGFHSSPPAAVQEARVGLAPPCMDETYVVGDISDLLLYGSASQNAQYGFYSDDYFPY